MGLLSAENHSLPTVAADTETTSFTVNGSHLNKIVSVNSSTARVVTMPSASVVPIGSKVTIISTGTGTIGISGTIDSTLTPTTLYQNEAVTLSSNGTVTWQVVSQNTLGHTNIVNSGTNTWTGKNTFSDVSGLPLLVHTTITSSGTWTVPNNVNYIWLFMRGGGGGGGAGVTNTNGGNGGGAGFPIRWYYQTVTPGDVWTVTIGAGGAGGVGTGSNGVAGGDTLFSKGTTTIAAGGGGIGYSAISFGGKLGSQIYPAPPVPSVNTYVQPDWADTVYSSVTSSVSAIPSGAEGEAGTGDRSGGNGGGPGGGRGGTYLLAAESATASSGSGGGGGGSTNASAGTGGNGSDGYVVIIHY